MASLANEPLSHSSFQADEDLGSPSSSKRKSEDAQPHQRAKRNRYISIACNECKRRKIKCNGQTPCQRCGNLNLECVYAPNCCNGFKDSQDYRDMTAHIASLQDQVNALYHDVNNLRAQMAVQHLVPQQPSPIDPSLQSAPHHPPRPLYESSRASPVAPMMPPSPNASRPKPHTQNSQPSFRGPTSNAFNFGVANSSLKTMGITSQNEEAQELSVGSGDGTREGSPAQNTPPGIRSEMQLYDEPHVSKDPLWSVSQEEALRLCRVYEDEMGLMYPVLEINKVIAYATKLYRFMEAAHRTGFMQQGFPGADSIEDDDTNILKMVLATAMTVEASGRSDLGQRMFEYVQPAIDNLLLGGVGIKGIRLLTMTAMYEFHRDNEGTSWRIIGLTARLCIELGLHRRETYEAMQDESERSETILLFWAIYVLDRRWSFGTGMPFALQDADIDPLLPKPEGRSPYLSAMIQYSAIGSKVWRTVASTPFASASVSPINTDEMGYLDYQVVQWHRSIPAHLRFEHPSQSDASPTPGGSTPSRAAHRLRILLYLRANQMRILIYRPVLHSATNIMQHRDQAQTVVDVAKDNIRVLTHINQTSDLYRTQQVLFNAFLTSALAVLFLAVSHTPATFAESVKEEFYMSLDLVRGFSKGSWISKRLWKTIRVLKEVGPKLGLSARDGNSQSAHATPPVKGELDPSRSAAVAMAGLAGHNVDEMALYGGGAPQWAPGAPGSSSSPDGMANDLTHLFEAAGGYQIVGDGSANGSRPVGASCGADGVYNTPQAGADDMINGTYGGDEGLSNILKELF